MSRMLLGAIVAILCACSCYASAQTPSVPCPRVDIGGDLDALTISQVWDEADHQVFDQIDITEQNEENLEQLQKNFGMLVSSFPDRLDVYTIQRDLHGYMLVIASHDGVIGGIQCGLFITP